ncbi:MAG: radical SAM protein [Phycisphaerales bacterium]|nr:radical SAM protein [Phycisphaerales bacterium]
MAADQVLINEVFHSVQGESTWAGLPCVFIRLRGCPLRCHYCDTEYAFREGKARLVEEVVEEVAAIGCPLIEVTGGEPLLQPAVHPMMSKLCDLGHTVLIETAGAHDISVCDERVIRILDIKTPGSGESDRVLWENIEHLRPCDEVKFVLVDRGDYDWMKTVILEHDLTNRVDTILLSPAFHQESGRDIAGCPGLDPSELVSWMLEDRLPVRMQLQMHKFIWDPKTRVV